MTIEQIFNKLLAEEYQQWYSYFQASRLIEGYKNRQFRELLRWQADDELNDHAHKLLQRMDELHVRNLLTSPNLWFEATTDRCSMDFSNPLEFVNASINSELAAINSYDMALKEIHQIAPEDSTTINILEDIKSDEEEHLRNLQLLLTEFQINN